MNLINTSINAQYGINNFQRVEFIIGAFANAPDRSNGQFFAEPEATGFYIERCDYPVQINLGSAQGVGNAFVARDGVEIQSAFRGLVLTHPPINRPAVLTLILFKNGASYSNQYAQPFTRLSVPWRVITDTAASSVYGAYVVPGSRLIPNLQLFGPALTVTSASLQLIDVNNSVINPVSSISQNIGGATVAYNAAANYAVGANIAVNGGASYVANFPEIVVPTNAVEMRITVTGTGLNAAVTSLTGNFQ